MIFLTINRLLLEKESPSSRTSADLYQRWINWGTELLMNSKSQKYLKTKRPLKKHLFSNTLNSWVRKLIVWRIETPYPEVKQKNQQRKDGREQLINQGQEKVLTTVKKKRSNCMKMEYLMVHFLKTSFPKSFQQMFRLQHVTTFQISWILVTKDTRKVIFTLVIYKPLNWRTMMLTELKELTMN